MAKRLLNVLSASIGRYAVAHVAAQNGGAAHWIEDWVNLRALKIMSQHTTAVIVAVVLFWFVGFIVQRLLHEGVLRRCVLIVDEFVLLCLFIFFGYELFVYLMHPGG